MKTDDLIVSLAHEVEPATPKRPAQVAARAGAWGLVLTLALFMMLLGPRPDIGASLPLVLAKAGLSAAICAVGLPALLTLARPGRALGSRLAVLVAALGASVSVGLIALIGQAPGERIGALTGGGMPWCLVLIPVLASPVAGALVYAMRDLAPTRLAATGAALGGVAGGVGAMVYALYCPVDEIAFVAVWYACAIAICAALGAVFGERLLRW